MRAVVLAFLAGFLPLPSYAHPNVPRGERTSVEKVEAPAVASKAKAEQAEAVTPKREMPLCASAEISAWNPAAAGWMCKATMWAKADTAKGG